MLDKIKFVLSSSRFWAIIGIAIVGYVKGLGFIDAAVADALVVLFGGYVAVRTSQDFQYPNQ
jgi:hypothetical protein